MTTRGEVAVRDVVNSCLSRIDERESAVGAWQHVAASLATEAANACDKADRPPGPLHGVPIGVKDVIDTQDMPTEYGSGIYRGHRPGSDADVVARLRAAGAIILGKTVSTEFAYFSPGKTSNPSDLSRTPGGSSSGSAAAVADAMVPLALGTQTAGSTIRPAAYCGVFGYKPTLGVIPTRGIKPLAESLDTLGLFGRSVDDLVLLASVLSNGLIRPAVEAALIRPRVGIVFPLGTENADGATWDLFARLEEQIGPHCSLTRARLPPVVHELVEIQKLMMAFEAARNFSTELRDYRDQISEPFLDLCGPGSVPSLDKYHWTQTVARQARADLDSVFEEFSFLLTPSALGEAPPKSQGTGDPVCNRIWTLLGVPCINIPMSKGSNGLPLGIQLIGRRYFDNAALLWAKWLTVRLEE
jgi:Asp-tRNA(Asn)/Glu-tRNA(Gln) amidotransferase A subunit family amidase